MAVRRFNNSPNGVIYANTQPINLEPETISAINLVGWQAFTLEVDQLVKNLKATTIWNKLVAVYPFYGGNVNSHSINIKNPNQYRLTFVGNWQHSLASGIIPDGTTTHANTGFAPSVLGSVGSFHMGCYTLTSPFIENGVEMGAWTSFFPNNAVALQTRQVYSGNPPVSNGYGGYAQTSGTVQSAGLDSPTINGLGFHIISRESNSLISVYKNNGLIATNTNTVTVTNPTTRIIYIAANNSNGATQFRSNRQIAFATIGLGLTASEVSTYYTVVNQYLTSIGKPTF